MILLRDTLRSRRFPIVNWALTVVNAVVTLFESSLGPNGIDRLFRTFARVPSHVSSLPPTAFIHPVFAAAIQLSIGPTAAQEDCA